MPNSVARTARARVPEDEARGRVQTWGRRRGELGEGVVIASPCPLDEPPSVHGPSSAPATAAGFEGYGVGCRRIDASIVRHSSARTPTAPVRSGEAPGTRPAFRTDVRLVRRRTFVPYRDIPALPSMLTPRTPFRVRILQCSDGSDDRDERLQRPCRPGPVPIRSIPTTSALRRRRAPRPGRRLARSRRPPAADQKPHLAARRSGALRAPLLRVPRRARRGQGEVVMMAELAPDTASTRTAAPMEDE